MGIYELQGQEINIIKIDLECICGQIDLLLKIEFNNKIKTIQFSNISMLTINDFSYPMCIQGFEIIDNKLKGWEESSRYRVHDYEEEAINFYCESIIEVQ